MAGVNMRLMKKTALDYSQVAADKEQMLIVNTAINVTNYKEGTLLVRVHGAPTIENDAAINVVLVRTAPTEEEPGLLFASGEPTLATVTIDQDTVMLETTALLVAPLPANLGGYLALAIKGVQDPSTAGEIRATISVDLNLKE